MLALAQLLVYRAVLCCAVCGANKAVLCQLHENIIVRKIVFNCNRRVTNVSMMMMMMMMMHVSKMNHQNANSASIIIIIIMSR